MIARSKIVLNVSFYENASLEMVRLSFLFANKIPVVSEIFENSFIDEQLNEVLKPVSYERIVERCKWLVANPDARKKIAEECNKWYSASENGMKHILGHALEIIAKQMAIEIRSSAVDPIPAVQELNSVTLPKKINIGSGRDYKKDAINADISMQWAPDWLVDFSRPLPWGNAVPFGKYGLQYVEKGMVTEIVASEVLEHVRELTSFMENIRDLLDEGGLFHVVVPYDLSYGAWQDPTHVRAFNERSFWYYCQWHWYLGWKTHRFDLISLKYELSDHGKRLLKRGEDVNSIVLLPRTVDRIFVTMKKRALTALEVCEAKKKILGARGARGAHIS